MPMSNLIDYSDNYSKTTGSLWQNYRDYSVTTIALTDACAIDNFSSNSALFKNKQKITGQTDINDTKDAEIMVPLKYISNFWRTLEIPPVNCKTNLILTWSAIQIRF